MTKLIAEIGWNHMGNLSTAKKMIRSAYQNGADLVKTQIFDTKYLNKGPWDNDGRREIYNKAQLNEKKYKILYEYSKNIGTKLFASVVNKQGIDLVKKFQRNIIKIPSAHNRDYELIKYSMENFKEVIVSLGASNLTEVKKLIKISKNLESKLVLLHCVSTYPCKFENINLPKIKILKEIYKNIGFSDHSENIYASVLSLQYNPIYIEKHFTINQNLPGRDNKLSILPSELREIKKFIKISKKTSKYHGVNFFEKEKIIREIYSKRWAT